MTFKRVPTQQQKILYDDQEEEDRASFFYEYFYFDNHWILTRYCKRVDRITATGLIKLSQSNEELFFRR